MTHETLLHYRIHSKLGAGGMGEVYVALDTKLDRRVALKLLPDKLAGDADWLERFRREARTVAALNHPNIVTLYSIEEADGRHFLTMELVEGETLDRAIRFGKVAPAKVHEVALALAEALATAHKAGVVHRDLKPTNIMVDGDQRLKILDFGLAKRARGALGDEPPDEVTELMTRPGTVMGTIRYMSPEQARGLEATTASDIFSLGIILYELATGKAPFVGRDSTERLAALLRDKPRPIRELNPQIPELLAATIERCLEADPERRFGSADDLVAELRAPSEALPGPAAAEHQSASIAVLPFHDLSPEKDQEYFCDGLAEELIGALSKVPALKVIARSSAFRFRTEQRDVREIAEALGVESVLEGSVRKAGNRVRISIRLIDAKDGRQLWSETFDRELVDVFGIQEDIARRVVEELALEFDPGSTMIKAAPAVGSASVEAYNLYLRGRHAWNKRTPAALADSLRMFQQAIELDPALAAAWVGVADAYALLGTYGAQAPRLVMPRAAAAAQRALEIAPKLAGPRAALGYVQSVHDWQWEAGERNFREAIRLNASNATAHQWFALANLVPRGRFELAEKLLRRATELDPLAPAVTISVGLVHYFSRRFDIAKATMEEALALEETFAFGHLSLARVLSELEEHEAALAALERARQLSGSTAELEGALGYALGLAGRVAEAEEMRRKLELRAQAEWVSPSVVAQVPAALGREQETLELLRQALAERATDLAWLRVRPVFGRLSDSPELAVIVGQLGLGGSADAGQDADGSTAPF